MLSVNLAGCSAESYDEPPSRCEPPANAGEQVSMLLGGHVKHRVPCDYAAEPARLQLDGSHVGNNEPTGRYMGDSASHLLSGEIDAGYCEAGRRQRACNGLA